ncbi:MAG TPA: nucleotidyl transferase AbiEii/AbiGii toxin family protein [Solirubrobacteraceae bacterium]|nr:nucleotidyl transferase AbiEii/AbiGii toxin family protein [Solirubrobacteraceae bacterium]
MISKQELLQIRAEWQVDVGVIEKDYVLGWVLAAVAAEPELTDTWIFKGGTCLRKCYYETYRFSEDLDFTIVDGGPERPDELTEIFGRVASWLRQESGIELLLDGVSFVHRKNLRGKATTQGRLAYRGPNPQPTLPKLRLDLTSDEVLVEPPVVRTIVHPYGDDPLPVEGIPCYSLAELAAEKTRALAERCRPRDLYDIVHMHRHPDLLGLSARVMSVLAQKCAHAGIGVPNADTIRASPYVAEIEQEWQNMLAHQLPAPLPPFAEFWNELDAIFAWLAGERPRLALPRAEFGRDLDPEWMAPRAITSWRRGVPLETIRYAGANRLKVELDYRAAEGRRGPRLVEPYSLRRTQDGNLVLFVVNDRGELRSYRVDRIAGVRATTTPFTPRYVVEF